MRDLNLIDTLEEYWTRKFSDSDKELLLVPFIEKLRQYVKEHGNSLSGLELSWPEDFPPRETILWDFIDQVITLTVIEPTSNGLLIKFQ